MDFEKDSDFGKEFRNPYDDEASPNRDLLVDFETFDEPVHVENAPVLIPEDKKQQPELSQLLGDSDETPPEGYASERSADEPVTKSEPLGDDLLIEEVAAGDRRGKQAENVAFESVPSNVQSENFSKFEFLDPEPSENASDNETSDFFVPPKQEKPSPIVSAPSVAATDHVNTAEAVAAMDSSESSPAKCKESCPFSPGVWFNPEKLHPVVADYVYWRDPKKTGVVFGTFFVLLLSLKFVSLISVFAYTTLAVLSVTVSFRIYKNILQSVKKSNEGQPFKEYLDMDLSLSTEKIGNKLEVAIHHVNAVIVNLRSLVLVEDLFDTIKLIVLAWCLTYIGCWFDGMTIVILAFLSAFTLPKLYETNKTQIDTYAELIHVKGKELMETINSKIPLGKKKKNE